MSQPHVICIPKIFEDFFACRNVLAANRHFPENAQSLFCMQNCLRRKSSKSRKFSKTYWPAELSQPHVICIPKIFEDFFACRIVLAANHQYPEKTQSVFRMQNCLSRKSSISRNYSKTFSPAEISQPQLINIPKMLKVFFECRILLAANHQNPGNIQRLIGLLNCLSLMSSVYRKYSKTSSPAELSQPQIIKIAKVLKVFFACRIVYAAHHQYPENTQRLFARRIVLAANHQYPGNIQRFFRLQKCLSSKSSVSRECSKSFSPAELSQQQIIKIPKKLKVFFACRIVLAANHQYPGTIQRRFRLQKFLSRNSSISRKGSKSFSNAELCQPQIIKIPEIFKDLLAC